MHHRANPQPFLRVLICVLALVLLIPTCTAESSKSHADMPQAQMSSMDCCPTTATIQPPQACCTLHPQPAEQPSTTPLLTIPTISLHTFPELTSIRVIPQQQQIRTTASSPPLLILRI